MKRVFRKLVALAFLVGAIILIRNTDALAQYYNCYAEQQYCWDHGGSFSAYNCIWYGSYGDCEFYCSYGPYYSVCRY